ncbi:Hsp20/alpha crystallin family protein [Planosporangium flavigriseum]|nr:Hsp20/alpha crystallin family protein [Planosporangium flavigriseum]NJC67710.1 Hsp20/alpha crystallin family protein [Planosporangium flavigriseum]
MTSLAPRRGRQLTEQRGGRRGGDPLADLQDRMGDLLASFFADPFLAASLAPTVAPVWVPPVDIEETNDSYILEMDLPGVRPEDVNIELRDSNELRITGRYGERERTGTMRRQNRRTGEFEYDVILPGDVNADQIDATLEYGVLTVRAGKAQPQAKRIEVKGGGAEAGGGDGTAAGRTPPVAGGTAEATTGGVSSAAAPPPGSPPGATGQRQTRVSPGGGPGTSPR